MSKLLVKHTLFLSASRYIILAINFTRNIILAKILGTEDYSYWVLFSVILSYIDFAHLGLRTVGDRDIPRLLGEGKDESAQTLTNTLYGSIVTYSAVLSLCFVVVSKFGSFATYLPFNGDANLILITLNGIAVILITDQVARFFLMYMRTLHRFVQSSVLEASFEFIKTLLLLGLVVTIGAIGIPIGYTTASLGFAGLLLFLFRKDVAFQFTFKPSLALFRQSTPLLIYSVGTLFVLNIDRLFGGYVLLPVTLGQYGLGVQLIQLPVLLSFGLRDVLVPTLGNLFGKQNSQNEIKRLLIRAQASIALITPVFLGLAIITTDLLTSFFLTTYSETITYASWLSVAVFFLAVAGVPNIAIVIMRRHWLAIMAIAAGLVLFIVTWQGMPLFADLSAGNRLVIATSSLYVAFFLISNILALLHLKFTLREVATYIRVISIPVIPYITWLALYLRYFDAFEPLKQNTIGLLLLISLYIPVAIHFVRSDLIPSQITRFAPFLRRDRN